jgi:hypothetical protein
MINPLLPIAPQPAEHWQPGRMSNARKAELDRLYDTFCTVATRREDTCFDSLEADNG